jgi:hypothetical protein
MPADVDAIKAFIAAHGQAVTGTAMPASAS